MEDFQALGEVCDGCDYLKIIGLVSFWGTMENVMEIDKSDGCTTL